MLRAAGLVAAAEGPIRGHVAARRFAGDHVLYTVAVPGAPALQVEARGGEWPPVGQAIALQAQPGSVHVIPGSPDAASTPAALPFGHD